MSEASRLAVLFDGAPLDEPAARALWTEFSAHMEEHRGDMAGFAAKKGWQRVAPEYQQGKAVLVVHTGAVPLPPPAPRPPQAPAQGPRPQGQAKQGPRPQGKAKTGPSPKKPAAKPQAKPAPRPKPKP